MYDNQSFLTGNFELMTAKAFLTTVGFTFRKFHHMYARMATESMGKSEIAHVVSYTVTVTHAAAHGYNPTDTAEDLRASINNLDNAVNNRWEI